MNLQRFRCRSWAAVVLLCAAAGCQSLGEGIGEGAVEGAADEVEDAVGDDDE